MIEVRNLVFDYPGTRALDNVSFTIREGSITALVGPNGAGKTTLLRSLAAIEEPVSGSILMKGRDILEEPRSTHRQIGYLSDFFGLYEDLTVRRCLQYAAMSHGIAEEERERVVESCAERLDIADRLDMKAGALSRGQRQRLAIAQGIVHGPKFLLLDEPASGLDPEARHSLATLFRSLRDNGMTLLVSSHILSELEEYSTDMLVLRKGRIIDHAPVASETKAEIEIKLAIPSTGLRQALETEAGIADLHAEENRATFTFSGGADEQHRLLMCLMEKGLAVCSFSEQKKNMQEAYLRTVKSAGSAEEKP
ncbi:MAG: ABC transporter ATP-binding protein [Geobacter sp.]|nr:ABC transporter ATP-binding protein [Geobacter sp.]